jgi:hypothetical protein
MDSRRPVNSGVGLLTINARLDISNDQLSAVAGMLALSSISEIG